MKLLFTCLCDNERVRITFLDRGGHFSPRFMIVTEAPKKKRDKIISRSFFYKWRAAYDTYNSIAATNN